MLIEFQTEQDDEDLPARLLSHFATANLFATENIEQDDENVKLEEKQKGTAKNRGYYIYPEVICPFPHAVSAPVQETFQGKVILSCKFFTILLWEKDAREFLNTHVSASYFLLPVMKNADATLLKLAIEELAQRFQGDERELGRHLTGLHLLLQQSEMMSEEEKLTALEYLKRYAHLIKNDPHEE
ncbi:MAG TPA: hypothetical protein VNG51_07250 [Ktedonobacteraceae bacterium]|nr:hypothetical protein [Ktedonobacteraceae bacterium]